MQKINSSADLVVVPSDSVAETPAGVTVPPLDESMAQIALLEADLELIEMGAPALFARMREQLAPHFALMAGEFRLLVSWLGEECYAPKTPKSTQAQIKALAQFLAERCLAHYGVDLQELLRSEGLDPDPLPVEPVDAEQEEAWASFEWEDPAVWAERKRKTPRPKKKSAEETDSGDLQKRLYHGLARDLHPDKAEAAERENRTVLMQRLNAAYRAGDVRALLDLLAVHGSDARKAELGQVAYAPLLDALKKQRKELQKKLKQELATLPDWGVDWLTLLRSEDAQERLLRGERRVASEREAHLRSVALHLREPRELAKFLGQYGDGEWDHIF